MIQGKLGNKGAAAFDVQAVCSGFAYALGIADKFIRSGSHKKVLVIGAEVFSRILDWSDRGTCVLFGDGAGAVVLEASEKPGILATAMHADGSLSGILNVPGQIAGGQVTGDPFLRMDGPAVFKFAVRVLADIAEEEDQNGRIRSNILDTQRALSFLMRGRLLTSDQISDSKQILRNIDSLNSHTAFLFDKINFLMDATIGFININQNKRVNQLTVFSVVFMPINILAGIGGMSEFSMMTADVPWPVAYGGFIVGSAFIGILTYLLLKHFERQRLKK